MTNEEHRELLELAAKAAGYAITGWVKDGNGVDVAILDNKSRWQPLLVNQFTDCDGDAQRLAVILGISITPYPIYNLERHSVIAKQRRSSDMLRERNPTECIELYRDNPSAATRLAILRAAAEIGRAMP